MAASTISIYRITHRRYGDDPFSGEGGLRYASRWASNGQRVSYAADHLATATLEKIAGVTRPDLLSEMIFVKAQVNPAHVDELPEEALPDGWNALPATQASRSVGDAWLEAGERLVLRVPAVILPHTFNYVVNPTHPDADRLQVVEAAPLLLDSRVYQRLGTPPRGTR